MSIRTCHKCGQQFIGGHNCPTQAGLDERLRKANQQFVDVSVALMRYVPESEAAAISALQKLGEAHGYGWCQSVLGKLWDEKHGCAPRGSMGVTVKDTTP